MPQGFARLCRQYLQPLCAVAPANPQHAVWPAFLRVVAQSVVLVDSKPATGTGTGSGSGSGSGTGSDSGASSASSASSSAASTQLIGSRELAAGAIAAFADILSGPALAVVADADPSVWTRAMALIRNWCASIEDAAAAADNAFGAGAAAIASPSSASSSSSSASSPSASASSASSSSSHPLAFSVDVATALLTGIRQLLQRARSHFR
jgi:hypothetical protein